MSAQSSKMCPQMSAQLFQTLATTVLGVQSCVHYTQPGGLTYAVSSDQQVDMISEENRMEHTSVQQSTVLWATITALKSSLTQATK